MTLTPIQLMFDQAPLFALVVFRMAGLMMLAPMMGAMAVPPRIKALLALLLAAVVFPVVPAVAHVPNNLLGLAVGIGSEMLIGLTMGAVLSLMFVGVRMGSQMVGYQMGLGLANIVDPRTQANTNVLSQLYLLVATLIYVLMNGHLILIKSIIKTFETVPLMGALKVLTVSSDGPVGFNLIDVLTTTLTGSYMMGIRIAGPALIAVFLATLALGFISRTMPQLNILAAGFPVRIMLAFLMLIASFGSVCFLCRGAIATAFAQIGSIFI